MASNLTRVIRSELGRLEHPHKVLAPLLGLSRRAVTDRMTSKTDWRWSEIVALCAAYPSLKAALARTAEMDADRASELPLEQAS